MTQASSVIDRSTSHIRIIFFGHVGYERDGLNCVAVVEPSPGPIRSTTLKTPQKEGSNAIAFGRGNGINELRTLSDDSHYSPSRYTPVGIEGNRVCKVSKFGVGKTLCYDYNPRLELIL